MRFSAMFLMILMLGGALSLAACGGAASTAVQGADNGNGGPAQQVFVPGVDHRWFPIVPGMVRILEGTEDGEHRIEEIHTLDEPREIDGVSCTGFRETKQVGGIVTEMTTEWYAQDEQGNVWKFGETSHERQDDGSMAISDDSWEAGQGGAKRWMFLPAQVYVGLRIEGPVPGGGVDVYEVRRLDAVAQTAAGDFEGSMEIVENEDDPEDTDIILYAQGVGRVHETFHEGTTSLVELRTP